MSDIDQKKAQRYMNIGGAILLIGALMWIFVVQPYFDKEDLVDYSPKGSIAKVTYSKSDKSVAINGGDTELSTLVETGFFEPLKPGDDPNIVKEKIGEATRFRTEGDEKSQRQNAFREYEMEGYTLLLSTYLTRYAESGDDIFHTLESLPHGLSYYQILKGDALLNIPKAVQDNLEIIRIDINGDKYGAIELNLMGERVEKMRWYENRK